MTLVCIAAIWLGLIINRAKSHRHAVELIEKSEGFVEFRDGIDGTPVVTREGYDRSKHSWFRNWIVDHLGEEYGRTVVVAVLGSEVGDEEVSALTELPYLENLSISGRGITDAGAAKLARMTRLRKIALMHTSITDSGLLCLKDLPDLNELAITQSALTPAGIKALQRARPNLSISVEEPASLDLPASPVPGR